MNRADFDEHVDAMVKRTADLLIRKGAEYAGDGDRLANFKRNADKNGQTVLESWQTYWGKHVDSINSYMLRVKQRSVHYALKSVVAQALKQRANNLNGEVHWDDLCDPENFRKDVNAMLPVVIKEIDKELSESIDGRFDDNVNYSFLATAILKELREE